MIAEYYYTQDPRSAHKPGLVTFEYRGCRLAFQTDSSTFSRTELDRGTEILLNALPATLEGNVLDLGCGWGPIGVALGKAYPAVTITMTDINSRACELARTNAAANGTEVEVICADAYEGLPGRVFETIVQNPPIRTGKANIYRMFREARDHLVPGGELYLVIRKQQGAPSAHQYLLSLFPKVDIIEKEAGYWIFRCITAKGEERHEV